MPTIAHAFSTQTASAIWTKAPVAACIALLCLAHLAKGADAPVATAGFSAALILGALLCFISKRPAKPSLAFSVAAIVLLGAGLSGLIGNWYQARTEYIALWTGLALFGAGHVVGQSQSLTKWAWLCFLISGLVYTVSILGLAVLTRTSDPDLVWVTGRLAGTFGSPNTLATLMGLFVLSSLTNILVFLKGFDLEDTPFAFALKKSFQTRPLSLLLLLTATTGLVLTSSRAGISLTLVISVLMIASEMMPASARRFSPKAFAIWTVAAIALGALLVFLFGFDPQLNVRSAGLAEDAGGRWDIYKLYWNIWTQEWLTGYGLGSFNAVNDANTTLENAPLLVTLGAAHNLPLQWLLQTGLLGTSLGLLVLCLILARPVTVLGETSRRYSRLIRTVMFVSALLLIHGLVDYALEIPSVMWTYAFLLGLVNGIAVEDRQRRTLQEN